MPTTERTYRLLFYSERLLPRVNGGYTGCRIATHANGCAMATLGESTISKAGRTKGKAGRRSDLKRGWRGTGDTTRPGYNQSHIAGMSTAMYPWLPVPQHLNTRDFGEVVAKLDDGYALGISVRLGALPTSAELDDYTRADHQVLIYGHYGDETRAVDPMHYHSSKYIGDKVPLSEVRKAAKAIAGGVILTELYPIGEWTAEAMLRKRKNAELRLVGMKLDRVTAQYDDTTEALREANKRAERLEVQLRNAADVGWESALVKGVAALETLRTQGPQIGDGS